MKAGDKEARIVEEEARVVNGAEVLCLTMEASPEGIPVAASYWAVVDL